MIHDPIVLCCVCSRIGTKHHGNRRVAACDTHARDGASDLSYASIVRNHVAIEVADMRERCAKVADDGLACFEIAAAIRLLK